MTQHITVNWVYKFIGVILYESSATCLSQKKYKTERVNFKDYIGLTDFWVLYREEKSIDGR